MIIFREVELSDSAAISCAPCSHLGFPLYCKKRDVNIWFRVKIIAWRGTVKENQVGRILHQQIAQLKV